MDAIGKGGRIGVNENPWRSGLPTAIRSLHPTGVLSLHRHRPDQLGTVGVKDCGRLHHLIRCATHDRFELHLRNIRWFGNQVSPLAEYTGAISCKINAADGNARIRASDVELLLEDVSHAEDIAVTDDGHPVSRRSTVSID